MFKARLKDRFVCVSKFQKWTRCSSWLLSVGLDIVNDRGRQPALEGISDLHGSGCPNPPGGEWNVTRSGRVSALEERRGSCGRSPASPTSAGGAVSGDRDRGRDRQHCLTSSPTSCPPGAGAFVPSSPPASRRSGRIRQGGSRGSTSRQEWGSRARGLRQEHCGWVSGESPRGAGGEQGVPGWALGWRWGGARGKGWK